VVETRLLISGSGPVLSASKIERPAAAGGLGGGRPIHNIDAPLTPSQSLLWRYLFGGHRKIREVRGSMIVGLLGLYEDISIDT